MPYFNWGPGYVHFVERVMGGTWKQEWLWLGPDWKDINNPDTSNVGFLPGDALSPSARSALERFIGNLGAKKVELFEGPLYYQDGSTFLKPGEIATDKQVWYMEQFLKGMKGQSRAK